MGDLLSTTDHNRDVLNLRYVYAVVSRRAQGISVGINLNTNNKCNFRCVYCQVPGLTRGAAPHIQVDVLADELRQGLERVTAPDFMSQCVPQGMRRLNDVALSGNGEPTASPQFAQVIACVHQVLASVSLLGTTKVILITNGTLVTKPRVLKGIRELARHNGEVWFKLDSATKEGFLRINNTAISPQAHLHRLATVAGICPTWIQTMVFARNQHPPKEHEVQAYLAALDELVRQGVPLKGVLLYGLARQSHQPEAPELSALDQSQLNRLAQRIRALGLAVQVSA